MSECDAVYAGHNTVVDRTVGDGSVEKWEKRNDW